jgi:alkyldihydroxyacetonephosphate synthase
MSATPPPVAMPDVDANQAAAIAALVVEVPGSLVAAWRGAGLNVITGASESAPFARDWWPRSLGWTIETQCLPANIPAAVVRPRSTDDVARVLRDCSAAVIPVTTAGGRSGVCGAALPVHGGVVLDMTSLGGLRSVDAVSGIVTVGAGTFGDELEECLRADHDLTVGHWPQSMALATVGGWVACRGAGQYSTRYGTIADLVAGLECVLADGTVVQLGGRSPREAAGPDLLQLVLGSEGTLAVVTEVSLRARPQPRAQLESAWTFASFTEGLDVCRRILRRGATPAVLRLYDERESVRQRGLGAPDGRHALLVMDEGDPVVIGASMRVVEEESRAANAERIDDGAVTRWLSHRNDVSALGQSVAAGWVVDTIEVAGTWTALPIVHERVTAAIRSIDGTKVVSCHQSHAYPDGACLYFTIAGRSSTPDSWYRSAWDAAMQATIAEGASISHHHGIGLLRGPYLRSSLGSASTMLDAMKQALDPMGILNPGKLGFASRFGSVRVPS